MNKKQNGTMLAIGRLQSGLQGVNRRITDTRRELKDEMSEFKTDVRKDISNLSGQATDIQKTMNRILAEFPKSKATQKRIQKLENFKDRAAPIIGVIGLTLGIVGVKMIELIVN